jgi:hypothetical protein
MNYGLLLFLRLKTLFVNGYRKILGFCSKPFFSFTYTTLVKEALLHYVYYSDNTAREIKTASFRQSIQLMRYSNSELLAFFKIFLFNLIKKNTTNKNSYNCYILIVLEVKWVLQIQI